MLDRPEGRGCPLRRLVFAICIAAWALRVLFLCIPDPLSIEAAMTGGLGLASPAPLNLGPQPEQSFDLDRPLREARDAFEKSYFEFHLAQENGSMTRVAEKTGLERTHLYRKLKQLGVDLSRNKRSSAL